MDRPHQSIALALCSIAIAVLATLGASEAAQASDRRQARVTDDRSATVHATGPAAWTSIVGGTPAAGAAFPGLAFVTTRTASSRAMACTGTIVAPAVVLTAAHCFVDDADGRVAPPGAVRVVTGRTARVGSEPLPAARILIHPAYDPFTARSDAALILLAQTTGVAPVMLAGADDGALAAPGAPATIAGWGMTSSRAADVSPVLQSAATTVLADSACSRLLGGYEPTWMLCSVDAAGGFTTSTCNGDSGGPLLAARPDGAWVQTGITSWGSASCDTRVPQAFTRVSAHRGWIDEQLAMLPATPLMPPGRGGSAADAESADARDDATGLSPGTTRVRDAQRAARAERFSRREAARQRAASKRAGDDARRASTAFRMAVARRGGA